MFSRTDIVNNALAHVSEHRITDHAESSPSAVKARTVWPLARLEALSAYEWGFASKVVKLDRSNTTPVAEWQYAYDKPGDFVRIVAVSDCSQFDRDNVFYHWADRDGRIETDAAAIYLHYVYDHDTVGKWPVHFVDYMAVTLAQRINPSITTSQSTGEALASMKMRMLTTMRARDAQQQPRRRPPRGNWIRALRSGGMTTRS